MTEIETETYSRVGRKASRQALREVAGTGRRQQQRQESQDKDVASWVLQAQDGAGRDAGAWEWDRGHGGIGKGQEGRGG